MSPWHQLLPTPVLMASALHLLLPGDFINAFLTFVFVIATLYFCVVIPL
jgi:hypothetical protein